MVQRAAALPEVRQEVEANHDNNRWWPLSVSDTRLRMLAAGWSTRVSYRMIGTYSGVITAANAAGFDALAAGTDAELAELVTPLGLTRARVDYFRSLSELTERWAKDSVDPLARDADHSALIQRFAEEVSGASYKVAQCALLYARGYHCGIIPVDSGMVTKLAPVLGLDLPGGPVAHEHLRHLLEGAVRARAEDIRSLIGHQRYAVTIPADALPTWCAHLVLIYFKRLYLNRPADRLCRERPVCATAIDCDHTSP
ncbi:hypothetical protein ABZ707_02290 [Streptomyces sp. NPDC006923]|uniref:hypothetical protein n=1 Tax=Streptomyces sp. NPDC006923 TaxID=3155355 RepID=UPI0033FE6750